MIFLHQVTCWPSPTGDGTVDVNIEYELENEGVNLYDVVISIPLPYVLLFRSWRAFTDCHNAIVLAHIQLLTHTPASGSSTRQAILWTGRLP